MPLLDLTPEVLHDILTCSALDPVDVACAGQTCKTLAEFTDPAGNPLLWKALFLNLFDTLPSPPPAPATGDGDAGRLPPGFDRPRPASGADGSGWQAPAVSGGSSSTSTPPDYARLVRDRCRARGTIRSPHSDKKIKNRSLVLHTLVDVFRTAENRYPGCSKNADFLVSLLSSKSAIADWLDVSAPSSFANEDSPTRTTRASRASRATQSSITPEQAALNMAACELHFAGQSMAEVAAAPYRSGQAYRELVYRASNFTEETYHGPLVVREDGEIWTDWRLLDAIARVMALNVKSAWHQWAEPEEMNILPYGFEKAVFWKQPGPGRDWAGVESKWSYIYAFIDYNDFFAYNFAEPVLPSGAVNSLSGISEAVGGVNSLTLKLLPEEDTPARDRDEDPDSPHPTLYFSGTSTGPNGSLFRGSVRMLDDGQRWWTFVIRYGGSDRWQTEGIEVGGRGVYGMWTDVAHEELSPCGPVWYFRE